VSRVLSALAFAFSLVSSAMAGDLSFDVFAPEPVATSQPPAASLDWGVFEPMPVAGDSVTSDMFDVFSRGKTVEIKPAKLEPYVSKPNGYPLRSTRWTGLPKDIPGAVHHLSTGHHAGQFEFTWLAGLSWDELDSLHADHHEGCVSPAAKMVKAIVPGPPKVTVAAPQPQALTAPQASCAWRWNGRQWVYQCR
jgi:hypothetical protein